jgi:hypothetical protein
LSQITDENTLLYYLDDDNVIHPNLYSLLNIVDEYKMYTFNQENRLLWTNTNMGNIDSAMVLIDYRLCKNITWIDHSYDADWKYIKDCYEQTQYSLIRTTPVQFHRKTQTDIQTNIIYYVFQ